MLLEKIYRPQVNDLSFSQVVKVPRGLRVNKSCAGYVEHVFPWVLMDFSLFGFVSHFSTSTTQRSDQFIEEKMFCHHCDESLAGHRYVLRDDHPYCIKCYENVFANNCDECGKLIGIDSKVTFDLLFPT